MITKKTAVAAGVVASIGAMIYLAALPEVTTSAVKIAWDVPAGATVTGLEQSDSMPPTWRNVAEFPVSANGGSFTASVVVVNGKGFWRAYTR